MRTGFIQTMALGALLGFGLGGCSKEAEADYNTLEYRDGVAHVPREDVPFTGRAVSFFANGQKKIEVHFEKGLEEGPEVAWYQDGKKESEGTRKKGEWEGVLTHWYADGSKMAEYTYVEGKLTTRKNWDEKGNPITPTEKAPLGK
jgi:antitoxin component YwqK of YwqJK toxin-antitoxin module